MHLSKRKTDPTSPAHADWFDCVVCEGGRKIGRIYEDRNALPELRWYWSLTVLGACHVEIPTSGRAPTLDEAKAQFEASFKKWLLRKPKGRRFDANLFSHVA
jgi:hypothetical protein